MTLNTTVFARFSAAPLSQTGVALEPTKLPLPKLSRAVLVVRCAASPLRTSPASASLAHPREIFKPAIAHSAYAFVVVHNTSEDPSPNEADSRSIRRLSEGSRLLQIQTLDHVIVVILMTHSRKTYCCPKLSNGGTTADYISTREPGFKLATRLLQTTI